MIGTLTLNDQVISKSIKQSEIGKIFEVHADSILEDLMSELSPAIPWGDRQIAARKIGRLRNPNAVSGLLAALQQDNFWMVRCSIIQALEMINDNSAVPVLSAVAQEDSFQVVRSYAAKAVERLS